SGTTGANLRHGWRRLARPARLAAAVDPHDAVSTSGIGAGRRAIRGHRVGAFRLQPGDPTPTIGGRLLLAVAAGYRDDGALAERADVLSFNGPELRADLEIIGVLYVEVARAVDTPSADVAVRISAVDPNGRSRNISDGYVRIGGIPRRR
ncbi:MAG: uncharacterized protein QOE04_1463, partial [Mycobacterium sp.]|nr:uncharacterized protein [Mycobacterium sp.]